MAKHVLFVVHGMGRHNEGWIEAENGPVAALSAAAEHYSDFSPQRGLTDSVEFVEIRYDDIFDAILTRWSDLSSSLGTGQFPDAAPDAVREITAALSGVSDPDNWFAAQAMDVAFYSGFKLIRRLVALRVAATIMKTIADSSEDRKYSLLAHSLGTAVAHDAIHQMATTSWLSGADSALPAMNDAGAGTSITLDDLARARARYGDKPFGPGLFKFEAIFMISNTSALLQKAARNAYESVVRPAFSGGGPLGNSCLRYYNIDHLLDPISKVRRFRAAEAWPTAAANGTARDVFDIRHVHDINIHALDHYLVHPSVHAEILGSLCPARFRLSDYQAAQDRAAPDGDFPTWGDQYTDEDLQDEILQAFETLRIRERDGLARILPAFQGLVHQVAGRIA